MLAYSSLAAMLDQLDDAAFAELPTPQRLAIDRVLLRVSADGPVTRFWQDDDMPGLRGYIFEDFAPPSSSSSTVGPNENASRSRPMRVWTVIKCRRSGGAASRCVRHASARSRYSDWSLLAKKRAAHEKVVQLAGNDAARR